MLLKVKQHFNLIYFVQVIQTANGQQILLQNVGQSQGNVQINGTDGIQQLQVYLLFYSFEIINYLGEFFSLH